VGKAQHCPQVHKSAAIRDVALKGLSEAELEKGKAFRVGSYPLRFDTSRKIASQLTHIPLEGRSPDWLVERNREIAAVTTQAPSASRRAPSATAPSLRPSRGSRMGSDFPFSREREKVARSAG
jgi:hypothetical protein